MGYSGLESATCSDRAADMFSTIWSYVAVDLERCLEEVENQYNTDGAINVAFFFADVILPTLRNNMADTHEYMGKVAQKAREKMKAKVKMAEDKDLWADEDNRKYHLRHYKRLLKAVDTYIKAYEEVYE